MKNMAPKLKRLWEKYKEIINYFIIGILTTLLNYISFAVLVYGLKLEMHLSNIIAWLIGVIFAYFTNKLFVFESKSFKTKVLLKEILSFGVARVFSLLLEELILFIFVNRLGMEKLIIKLFANIIVVIVNYILSKFIIFKKEK